MGLVEFLLRSFLPNSSNRHQLAKIENSKDTANDPKKAVRTSTSYGAEPEAWKASEFAFPSPSHLYYQLVKHIGEDGSLITWNRVLAFQKSNLPFKESGWHSKVYHDGVMQSWCLFEVQSLTFQYNIWKEQLNVKMSYEGWIRVHAGMYQNIDVCHWVPTIN